MVNFETRKQGASAGDRVYGLLFFAPPGASEPLNLAVEAVRTGNASPKASPDTKPADDATESEEDTLKKQLQKAFDEAKQARVGVHSELPLIRKLKNAGDDFETLSVVQNGTKLGNQGRIKCVIEYIFDGSRFRVQVTDPVMGDMQHSNFTLLLAGVTCPRLGNAQADPPIQGEPFAAEARQFVEMRLLQVRILFCIVTRLLSDYISYTIIIPAERTGN